MDRPEPQGAGRAGTGLLVVVCGHLHATDDGGDLLAKLEEGMRLQLRQATLPA